MQAAEAVNGVPGRARRRLQELRRVLAGAGPARAADPRVINAEGIEIKVCQYPSVYE
jgi:hypothetical protein